MLCRTEVLYLDDKLNNINEEKLNNTTEEISETSPAEGKDNPGKKKLIKRIVISLAGVLIGLPLILIIAAGCIFGFDTVFYALKSDNLMAFINSMRYSQEDIENKMEENQQKLEKIVEESPLIEIRGGLTEEETKALAEGKITQEQAVQLVKGEITLEEAMAANQAPGTPADPNSQDPNAADPNAIDPNGQVPQTPATTPATAPEQTPATPQSPSAGKTPQPTTQTKPSNTTTAKPEVDEVSTLVAELYVVQADFLSRLEAVGDQAYADYVATHYDRSQVDTIVNSYTATVGAMESECDKKVSALVKDLKAAIKKANGDMNLAKEVTNYYYTEKSLKKSYYINKIKGEDYK